MQVRVLNHIAVTVSDTQRSLDFYVGKLGLVQVEQHQLPKSSIDAVFGLTGASGTSTRLQVPGQPDILIDIMEILGAEAGTVVQPLGSIGSTHMAFTVDNLDEAVAELKAKGVSFISEPVTFHLTEGSVTVCFMHDPDGNYEELIGSNEIDAIYLSLPNHLHAQWSIAALEAGKHVLCEKPLALTVAEVDRMTEAAQRAGRVLQEASATRFHPQTADIASIIASGTLGRILLCQSAFEFTLPARKDFRLDPVIGGGALWDVGCYPVTFFQAVLGENPEVVDGQAFIGPSGVDLAFAGMMGYRSGASVQFTASSAALNRNHKSNTSVREGCRGFTA